MPAQFVEAAPLGILLPFDDELVFLVGNGTLVFEVHFRPETFRDERPRQPVHRKAEVVQLPQMNIRADRARLRQASRCSACVSRIIRLRMESSAVSFAARRQRSWVEPLLVSTMASSAFCHVRVA